MPSNDARSYEPSYRESRVDERLNEHDTRITANERRWLMTKGALAMMAAIKGVDFAITHLSQFL